MRSVLNIIYNAEKLMTVRESRGCLTSEVCERRLVQLEILTDLF